ncbi:NUDIX hydrolase [Fervidibacillus halotolerans]|uniref:NUDIX hydrolase n=1 Tax=Fervidibacillus halotolerans TaxID=2980027 RepID=A0A9E8RYD0_9BACI|nr:NUDIX hydrolase [Fervidibacillus halotolerans]WAA12108.1 NUDIX hydrolase [Fervidibacillus halotolerans]
MEKKIIYKNDYFEVHVQHNILSLKNKKGGAAILPLTKEGEVFFIEIYREPIHMKVLEIPRGFQEKGENPLETAKRELKEEIDAVCEQIVPLGSMYTDSGISDSQIHLFLGKNTILASNRLQISEGITRIVKIPFDLAYKMALEGTIKDSFTLVALMRSANIIREWNR